MDIDTNKHYLQFDRPNLYKCSCGLSVTIFPPEFKEEVFEKPEAEVEYLECGHAKCASIKIRNEDKCILCIKGM